MDYLSASEMGKRWNLSRRRVSVLCSEGRIPGAQKIGGNWMIPSDAEQPRDARFGRSPGPKDPPPSRNRQESLTIPSPEQMAQELMVQDLFTLGYFQDWVLVGGKSGRRNHITSLNMMESPDVANWVVRNQFIVSTGYCIRENPEVQKQLILDLSRAGCAGLAIKVQRYFRTIPEHMIRTADECGFPLIEIPSRYNISEVMNSITRKVYARRLEEQDLSYRLFTQFTEAAFENNAEEIAHRLGTLIQSNILVSDLNWKKICGHVSVNTDLSDQDMSDQEKPVYLEEGYPEPFVRKTPIRDQTYYRYIFRIGSGDSVRGYLSVWTKWSVLTGNELLAVRNAVEVLDLLLTSNQRAEETLYTQRSIFLIDAYFGRVPSESVAQRRAASTGMSVTAFYRAVVVRKYRQDKPEDFLPEEVSRIRETVRQVGSGSEIFPIDNYFVCVCRQDQKDSRQEAEHLVSRIRAVLSPRLQENRILFSVGNASSVRQLHTTFRQARETADLAAARLEPSEESIFWFEDLALPSVLITIDRNKRDLLRGTIVSRLAEYDAQHGGELLETIDVYLACGRNVSRTSRELFIHRNTLLFRLERIRDLLGMDLEDPDNLLLIEIALRLRSYR